MMSILKNLLVALSLTCVSSAYAAEFEYNYGNPLIDAADVGNEYLVVSHISNGVSVNSKGNFGTTALMRAAIRGNEIIVRRLLESGADVNARDVGGATALHLAARTGNLQIVEMLLKRGADPDAQDNDGYTPLQRATQTQYVSVVAEMLKNNNVSVKLKNKEGLSAMDIAHKTNNKKIIDMMGNNVAQHSQSQLLSIPENKNDKPEVVAPAPIAQVKTEEIKPIEEEKIEEHKVEPLPAPVMAQEPKAKLTPPVEPKEKNNELVKDLRSLINKKKTEAVVPDSPKEEVVQEAAPIVEETPQEEEQKVQVSVAEAIKVPDEIDLRDSTNKLNITHTEAATEKVTKFSQPEPVAKTAKQLRTVNMEISSFESEEEGVAFWDKLMKMEHFQNRNAELIEDKSEVRAKFILKLSDFKKSAEVFEGCKTVKKANPNILCYVVHDVN